MKIKNFDITSAKYFILTLIVCLLFVLLVANAFQYLPDNQNLSKKNIIKTEDLQNYNDTVSSVDEDEEFQDDEEDFYDEDESEDFSETNNDESSAEKGEFLKIWD